jgi:hypothetical protein
MKSNTFISNATKYLKVIIGKKKKEEKNSRMNSGENSKVPWLLLVAGSFSHVEAHESLDVPRRTWVVHTLAPRLEREGAARISRAD